MLLRKPLFKYLLDKMILATHASTAEYRSVSMVLHMKYPIHCCFTRSFQMLQVSGSSRSINHLKQQQRHWGVFGGQHHYPAFWFRQKLLQMVFDAVSSFILLNISFPLHFGFQCLFASLSEIQLLPFWPS